DGLKRSRVFVVAVNITQQATQLVKGRRFDPSAVFLDAVSCPRSELIDIPTCLGHPDNRHIEVAPFNHRLQRRKDFLVGEIAGGTEEDQRIRMGNVHVVLLIWWIFPSGPRNQSASPKAVCLGNLPRRAKRTVRTVRLLIPALARLHRLLPSSSSAPPPD